MKVEIKQIYETPKDDFSFSISKNFEGRFLITIEEMTDLSIVDFAQAEKREYADPDGTEMIEYKWKVADVPKDKYESLEQFVRVDVCSFSKINSRKLILNK